MHVPVHVHLCLKIMNSVLGFFIVRLPFQKTIRHTPKPKLLYCIVLFHSTELTEVQEQTIMIVRRLLHDNMHLSGQSQMST